MLAHEIKKKIDLPGGGSITVTVSSSAPINEQDFLLLKSPQAAIEMAACMTDMANALRPPGSPEIRLDKED